MYIEHKEYETLGREPSIVTCFLNSFLFETRSYDEFGEEYDIEEVLEGMIAKGAFREDIASDLIKANKQKLFYNLIAKNFNLCISTQLDPDTKEYVREQIEDASKKEYETYARLDNAYLPIYESVAHILIK